MKITKTQLKQIIKEELEEGKWWPGHAPDRDHGPPVDKDPYSSAPHADLLGLIAAAKRAVRKVQEYKGHIPPGLTGAEGKEKDIRGHLRAADEAMHYVWQIAYPGFAKAQTPLSQQPLSTEEPGE